METAQGQVASAMVKWLTWLAHANSKHLSDSLRLPELKEEIDARASQV